MYAQSLEVCLRNFWDWKMVKQADLPKVLEYSISIGDLDFLIRLKVRGHYPEVWIYTEDFDNLKTHHFDIKKAKADGRIDDRLFVDEEGKEWYMLSSHSSAWFNAFHFVLEVSDYGKKDTQLNYIGYGEVVSHITYGIFNEGYDSYHACSIPAETEWDFIDFNQFNQTEELDIIWWFMNYQFENETYTFYSESDRFDFSYKNKDDFGFVLKRNDSHFDVYKEVDYEEPPILTNTKISSFEDFKRFVQENNLYIGLMR